jgi:hypothetical protein
VASSIPSSGLLSSSSDPSSSVAMAMAMKCDASLRVSLMLSTGQLCLRGWKDSSEPQGIGQGGWACDPMARYWCDIVPVSARGYGLLGPWSCITSVALSLKVALSRVRWPCADTRRLLAACEARGRPGF